MYFASGDAQNPQTKFLPRACAFLIGSIKTADGRIRGMGHGGRMFYGEVCRE
jgi:hypothetical protein